MFSPTAQELFSNDFFTLTTHGLSQGESSVLIEQGSKLHIKHQGQERLVEIPPPAAGLPGYRGDMPLLAAMYNLALHEAQGNSTAEGLLKAGFSWDGVWTRDVSYAIILGANLILPQECKASLESRVRDGKILQDTGTGGSWPISTDRVIWAEAAWLYYCTTGDEEWLNWSADIIEATIQQDDAVLTRYRGLYPGETSFIDWREQSYPDWMTPSDIGATYSLSTNILHATARRVLSNMRRKQGREEEATHWQETANQLRRTIKDNFWNKGTRQFGIMRTLDGHLDERVDTLGCTLCVLDGIAIDHANDTLNQLPRSNFGTPTFSPYKSSQSMSYHNRSVWPFVEAFTLLAYVHQRDIEGVERSMAQLFRAALLFGSNKENFNAVTGEANDTQQSSDGQLWSACGMLSLFYFALFGLRFEGKNLVFTPCLPKKYQGSHWLTGIRIRDMVLDIHISGYGTVINNSIINGKVDMPLIPLDTKGRLMIELELMPEEDEEISSPNFNAINWAHEDLAEPRILPESTAQVLQWSPIEGATAYRIYYRGKAIAQTGTCQFSPPPSDLARAYCVQAINEHTFSSLSKPFICQQGQPILSCAVDHMGEQGEFKVEKGQAWLDTKPCTAQLFFQEADLEDGFYLLRFLYSNASNSLRDGDGCAIRALYDGEQLLAYIPLPQHTEQGNWQDFILSAPFFAHLEAGKHEFSLRFTSDCDKGTSNECMLKSLELIRLQPREED